MPNNHEYYQYLKEKFFKSGSSEEFVAGLEFIVSKDTLMNTTDFYSAVYWIHSNFIHKFFDLDSDINHKLVSRFVIAYCRLLVHFVKLHDQEKNDYGFKSKVKKILNGIIDADNDNQFALLLSSKIIDLDLPAEFCLTVIAHTNIGIKVDDDHLKFSEIINRLYKNDKIWNDAATPGLILALTPRTPPSTAMFLHAGASKHCSKHAHDANLVFLFYMQSCWFATGNLSGCNFIKDCLPFAVGALSCNKERIPEWRWVLRALDQYPNGSMYKDWRNNIVKLLNSQYWDQQDFLRELGVRKGAYGWRFPIFGICSCADEDNKPIKLSRATASYS